MENSDRYFLAPLNEKPSAAGLLGEDSIADTGLGRASAGSFGRQL